jgi:hypothetical protein
MEKIFILRMVLGRWAVGLIAAFLFLLALFAIIAASGAQGGDTFFSNPVLAIPVMVAAFCGAAAFFTGLLAIIIKRERALFLQP